MYKKSKRKSANKRKGFTLVELLVVVAILAILATLAVTQIGNSTAKAAVAAHNANVRIIESAASMYLAEHGAPSAFGTINDDKTFEESDLSEHLQDWPKIPKQVKVNDSDVYTLDIDEKGVITVKPDMIPDGKFKIEPVTKKN